MHKKNERQFRTQFSPQEIHQDEYPVSNSGISDEIDIIDCLRIVYRYRYAIVLITLMAVLVSAFSCLHKPRMYQASTSIVPPTDRLSQGGLAGKLGGAGSLLVQGMLNEGDLSGLYLGILESRAVANVLVDRFDLMSVYGKVATRTDTLRMLAINTNIKASKDGIIHISVNDRDATRAAALANAYVEELDMQNKRLSGGQATSKRVFLETRLKEIEGELGNIESLQSREAQVKEMLFELLNRECEIAKMEEAKSMPTIQVLDKAIVPESGMGRGTIKKTILAGFVGFTFSFLLVFLLEYAGMLRKSDACKRAYIHPKDMSSTPIDEYEGKQSIVSTHRKKSPAEKALHSQQV